MWFKPMIGLVKAARLCVAKVTIAMTTSINLRILIPTCVYIYIECHLVTHEECAEQILHPCLPACFNERKVQEAFLRTFASLFYNYRIGFVDDPQEVNGPALASTGDYSTKLQKGVLYFSKEKFLKHADKDSRVSLGQSWDDVLLHHSLTSTISLISRS